MKALLAAALAAASPASAQDWLFAPREYDESADGRFVALGDLDQDGDVDVVQVDAHLGSYPKAFRVLANDGTGELVPGVIGGIGATVTLDPAKTYATYALRPICADVTGDGKLDLVLHVKDGPLGHGFELHPGNGDGTFGAPVFEATTGHVNAGAAGDLDGDGAADLALAVGAAGGTYEVRIWSWTGAGFAGTSALPATYVESMTAFDRDGDGEDELAYGRGDSAAFTIVDLVAGQPAAVATIPVPLSFPGPMHVFATDLEGDGVDDLIVSVLTSAAPYTSLKVQIVAMSNAGGAFTAGPVSDLDALQHDDSVDPLWICDWDLDGDQDLLTQFTPHSIYGDRGFAVLANDGAGGFALAATVLTKDDGSGAGAADLNGDGKPDFVAPRSVLLGDGTARSFPTPFPWQGSLSAGVVRDWDGDGDADFLSVDGKLLTNDGAGGFGTVGTAVDDVKLLLPPQTITYKPGATVAIVDLDGNGALDLVREEGFLPAFFGAFEVVGMQRFEEDGLGGMADAGYAAPPGVAIAPLHPGELNPTADLDGDGTPDLLGNGHVWPNTGAGFFAGTVAAYAGYPVAVGDADLDGDVDVFAALPGFETLVLHENSGGLLFQAQLVGSVSGAYFGRTGKLADVDDDGDVDALFGVPPAGKLRLYERVGAAYVEHELDASPYGVDYLDVLDVDGDGRTDVVAGPFLKIYPETQVSVHRRVGATAPVFEPVRRFTGTAMRASFDADADGDVDLFGSGPILNRAKHGPDAGLVRQYGAGSPGAGGAIPVLGATGPATAGSTTYALHLAQAVGGAPALLGLGLAETAQPDFPLPGMTLYVTNLLPPIAFSTSGPPGAPGAGELHAPFFPTPGLAGLSFFHQVVIADPTTAGGVSATNGLEVSFGL